MNIAYEFTQEDLLAYHFHHFEHSGYLKRLRRKTQWTVLISVISIAVLIAILVNSILTLIIATLVGIIYFVYATLTYRAKWEKSIRSMILAESKRGMFCLHEMELADDRFIERTKSASTTTMLWAIDKIESAEDYTFIQTNSGAVHIIPRRALEESKYQAFVEALNREWHEVCPLTSEDGNAPR